MKCMIIGKKQLLSIGAVLLIILFAAVCAMGVLAGKPVGHPIRSVEREDKKLAVTFTLSEQADVDKILPTLKKYNVKSTFFVTADWAADHPGRIAELTAAGQEFGCLIENTDDGEEAGARLTFCRQRIAASGGGAAPCFRTADGQWSPVLLENAGEKNIPVSWSIDGGDADMGSGVQDIADRVLAGAAPGSVVRLDCGGKYTAAVLPFLFESLIGKGYEPVALSALLYPAPYTVDSEGRQRAQ